MRGSRIGVTTVPIERTIMNSHVIVAVYVAIDETLKALGHETDKRAQMRAAEVLTVAVVAALYFGNHQERSLCVLQQTG